VHNIDLILTLTGGLSAALLLGYVTQRLGLSPIVGYLLAGTLVGPHTPGFVANSDIAQQLAEVGVILLMFGVGLQLHVHELLAVRRVAIPGAIAQSLTATALGAWIGHAFGWSWSAGIVFGMALSVASTVVLIRILADNRDLHTPTGHIAVGWLVVEDLFTVIALVLMPVLFGGGEPRGGLAGALALTVLKVGGLVAFTIVVGSRVTPRLLDHVAATGSRELFTLTVLVLALGIAVGSMKVFGVSMALGAFMAGLVVGRSDYSVRAATEALPMRDAFAVLFFVSVGMLLEPRLLISSPAIIAGTLAIVMIGKPLVALVIVRALRYPFHVALSIAIALAQVGEFSFILAEIGRQLGVLSTDASNTIVAAAIVSIVVNPLLYRTVKPIDGWVRRHPSVNAWLNPPRVIDAAGVPAPSDAVDRDSRAVVIGYGPTGKTVTRLLVENEVQPTVIEMNLETVRSLRQDGIAAVYGDAMLRDTLDSAGIARANTLILTSAGMEQGHEVIRSARALNPAVRVLARGSYLRDVPPLRAAGADVVFTGEGEVALAFVEVVLRQLRATPEQIDRERARVRGDLFDGAG